MNITGAKAFVTGGSGTLGRAICEELAGAGVDVAVGYSTGVDRAEAAARAVRGAGRKACAVPLDQASPEDPDRAVADAVRDLGGLDILINNAAVASDGNSIPPGDLETFTPALWDRQMAVNVRGPYLLARAAAPHLRTSPWGRIVNIGSTIGEGSWGAGFMFAPSKGAVGPLTRFLAAALAPEVTVNCVAPGLMRDTGLSGGASNDFIENWKNRAVLQRTTAVGDVARLVVSFCMSPTVTGQILVADGGIHFR